MQDADQIFAAAQDHYLHLDMVLDDVCEGKLSEVMSIPHSFVVLSSSETPVATLRCIAFSGMPHVTGVTGFTQGEGVLQLSKLSGAGGRHRLHFLMQEAVKTFEGDEKWNKAKKLNRSLTLTEDRKETVEQWDVEGIYTSKHGLKASSMAIEVEGNIISANAELSNLATMTTHFSSKETKTDYQVAARPQPRQEQSDCPGCPCMTILLAPCVGLLACLLAPCVCLAACLAVIEACLSCQLCKPSPRAPVCPCGPKWALFCPCCPKRPPPAPVVGRAVMVGNWTSVEGNLGEWQGSAIHRPGFADGMTKEMKGETEKVVHKFFFPKVQDCNGDQTTTTKYEKMHVIHVLYRLPLQRPTIFTAWVHPDQSGAAALRFVQELSGAATARCNSLEGTQAIYHAESSDAVLQRQQHFSHLWKQAAGWSQYGDDVHGAAEQADVQTVVVQKQTCGQQAAKWARAQGLQFWLKVALAATCLVLVLILVAQI
ncbi:ACSBG2 [Symbiodinium sp. CCMP2456]|nr:ACSBG2 [Symbiodinium sp. CCMP2456]